MDLLMRALYVDAPVSQKQNYVQSDIKNNL